MNKIILIIKKVLPKGLMKKILPVYHYLLPLIGAIIYRFPSKKIKVVAVTGTKGKTSTVEFINAILEKAGKKTALAGTLRFKIAENSKPNLYKMTMPGRFFMQKFLRDAIKAGCEYAVIEISSEAVKQYRNKFIDLNALIFTNLAPEHIESHGSYEKYVNAKLSIAKSLEKSRKPNKVIISNIDDAEGQKFLDIKIDNKTGYSLSEVSDIFLSENETKFTYKNIQFETRILGKFNIYNILGAIKYAESEKIDLEIVRKSLSEMEEIKGRAQKIECGQDFKVIVDYAHTPDSLKAIYETFQNSKKIAVFGSCGGGRDKWKRKEMAVIADKYCEEIILTDEDPYEDNPMEIALDLTKYFVAKKPEIILDRREAIKSAIKKAKIGDVVIITGKGTDPYIMRAGGVKEKWSDAEVVREELRKLLASSY
ncbi:MAG: UDP-N-acetylmuramyl-tripeptide synthetase [Candidatus Taylorbacteria bacterium]|nr:UDP-N-acetylmuramyl-tripeptide synthetase [Candidatus Taylorbacteria bacterium]